MRPLFSIVMTPDGKYHIAEKHGNVWYGQEASWHIIRLAKCESLLDIVNLSETDIFVPFDKG